MADSLRNSYSTSRYDWRSGAHACLGTDRIRRALLHGEQEGLLVRPVRKLWSRPFLATVFPQQTVDPSLACARSLSVFRNPDASQGGGSGRLLASTNAMFPVSFLQKE